MIMLFIANSGQVDNWYTFYVILPAHFSKRSGQVCKQVDKCANKWTLINGYAPLINSRMQAIVPYATSEVPAWLGAATQGVKRTRQFYKDHEQTFKKTKKAAKTIQKAWRARKGLDAMGHTPGSGTAKTDVPARSTNATGTRTLNFESLIDITRGDAINARERDVIDLRGFSICMGGQNNLTGLPLLVNVAVLSSKFDPTQNPTSADFFRGEGSSRGEDFDTSLQASEFHCLPINTDKYFVQAHHRMKLSRFGVNAQDHFQKKFYVPIKRQIRFDTTTSTSINRQFYLVWWCDAHMEPAASPVRPTALNFQYKCVTHFREPKR